MAAEEWSYPIVIAGADVYDVAARFLEGTPFHNDILDAGGAPLLQEARRLLASNVAGFDIVDLVPTSALHGVQERSEIFSRPIDKSFSQQLLLLLELGARQFIRRALLELLGDLARLLEVGLGLCGKPVCRVPTILH